MADQIIDKRTVSIPGPMGDVTPAALAAKTGAEAARDAAEQSAAEAASSAASAAASPADDTHVSAQVASGTLTGAAVDARAAAVASGTGPLIFTHFLTRDEALHVAISEDGQHVKDTGLRWKPADDATLGEVSVRDPSVVLYNGTYYVAFTRPTVSGGGAWGTTQTIGLVKTTDWVTFTEMTPIAMPPGIVQTWAPQWFTDSDGLHLLVALGTTTTAGAYFTQYELHPTNTGLTAWSTPVVMSGLPAWCIDVAVIKSGSTYHAYPSNQKTGLIEHWTAPSLTGSYTKSSSGNWASIMPTGHEGPQPIPLKAGGWRIYVDAYNLPDSIEFTDSTDLVTWSPLKSVDLPMRHVGAVQVSTFGSLRDRRVPQLNLATAWGHAAPFWGTAIKPGEVFKEFVQIVSTTSDSGGDCFLAGASSLGFTGIDYLSANPVADVNVMQCEPDINSAGVIHCVALTAPGTPKANTALKIAWRIVGWGPATTK